MPDKEIFLVKLEPNYAHHRFAPPFGILFVAGALERAGFHVRMYHEPGTNSKINALIEDIVESRPLFVGFSSFTSNCLLPTKEASQEIKKYGDIPVVWGGLHATMLPEQTLQNSFVDIIVMGEGEQTAVELARCLAAEGKGSNTMKDIPGIGYRSGERILLNESRPYIQNLDDYSPAWHLLDRKRYIYTDKNFYSEIGSKLRGKKVSAVITSRGCPHRCGYCYNQAVNKRKFRAQSPETALKDIKYLKDLGVSTLIFEDDNFFANKNRALEIIRNMDMKWSSTIRADYIAEWGEDFVAELKKHGCLELRIGAESGCVTTLDLIQKDLSVEHIRKAAAICNRQKINTLLNFMIGIPGETWADVRESLDFMDELENEYPYVTVGSPAIYIPWPGTHLSQKAGSMGFKPPDTLEGWASAWAQKIKLPPYVDKRMKFIGFYKSMTRKNVQDLTFGGLTKGLRKLARIRWKKRFFRFPIDYYFPALVLRGIRKLGLSSLARKLYE